jgi:DNA primase
MLHRQSNLRKILADIFGENFPINSEQFRINCINPECNDTKGNLEINMARGIFHCWICNYSGNLRDLLKDYLGYVPKIEKYQSPEDLQQTYDIDSFLKKTETIVKEKIVDYSILPKEYIYLGQNSDTLSMLGRKALKYVLNRMTINDIIHHKVGYCGIGKFKWRIIVPFVEDDRVVYFIARDFMGGAYRKYDNPKRDEIGIGKEEVVFNINGARMVKQAVICEGVFDAIRVGIDGVAILGVSISDSQTAKLLSMKKVYVMLDADAPNEAMKLAKKFQKIGKQVYLIKLAKGDPDDYTRDEIRHLILESKPFNELDGILN